MFLTIVDSLFEILEKEKRVYIQAAVKRLNTTVAHITRIAHYLEQLGLITVDYSNVKGPLMHYLKSPELGDAQIDENELINKLKLYKSLKDIKSANKLVYDVYNYVNRTQDTEAQKIYLKIRDYLVENFMDHLNKNADPIKKIDTYNIEFEKIIIEVDIIKQELEAEPFYILFLFQISDITRLVIEKIKDEVISKITFNVGFNTAEEEEKVKREFKKSLIVVMHEIFPNVEEEKLHTFTEYVVLTSLGMGEIEILLRDKYLEEVVINNANEPVWVYHTKYGWLKTNIILEDEKKIVHYATLAGRVVDKNITTLTPLMDGHLKSGDRINATLHPISTKGSTITIRKFSELPWSITDFIINKTVDVFTAAFVWTAMQYELSVLIVGGTGSGKTSALNVYSIFIPPNQRIISIEDTRELQLPKTLHWVPMETRLANPEGKGEITMLDLIVNSLRMRPDRIIVGEIRRKKEAEVLFEAMHTGHSVYATLHANTVNEAIIRLTTEPIGIPKSLLSAVDIMVVQNRSRRTGKRRTFEVAEITKTGGFNIIFSYNFKEDSLVKVKEPNEFYETLKLFSGLSKEEVRQEIEDKIKILEYLVSNKINNNEEIAQLINYYYINKKYLLNKLFGGKNR